MTRGSRRTPLLARRDGQESDSSEIAIDDLDTPDLTGDATVEVRLPSPEPRR